MCLSRFQSSAKVDSLFASSLVAFVEGWSTVVPYCAIVGDVTILSICF